MEGAFDRLVPDSPHFKHAEGNSDSHIKTALVGSSEIIWIENGRLALGRWQTNLLRRIRRPSLPRTSVKIVPD